MMWIVIRVSKTSRGGRWPLVCGLDGNCGIIWQCQGLTLDLGTLQVHALPKARVKSEVLACFKLHLEIYRLVEDAQYSAIGVVVKVFEQVVGRANFDLVSFNKFPCFQRALSE